ncbi:hypothetical protein [Streptomyces microflavus]|uniref:hypothetical protein n=1 Tax=Streptomyces microflavus TaxID=1919 RepID=UPI0033251032
MDDPIFVIHGVGNRDPKAFATTVAALQAASGSNLVPVYWGDLGADDQFVDLALPAHPIGLRDTSPYPESPTHGELAALLGPDAITSDGAVGLPEPVEEGVREALSSDSTPLRMSSPDVDIESVLAVLTDEWPTTRWLSLTDDPTLLREVGAALGQVVAESEGHDESWAGLRGPSNDPGTLRSVIRRHLAGLDRVAGAAVQAVVARVNHSLRSRFGPATTRFLGDVLVYQRHREQIQGRVWDHIASINPELGRSPDRPVRVVAHSLGGVIAVDMATGHDPMWTASLLTFGSQAAYFHLCDPRGGQLAPYAANQPVTLPASLTRWTNLWQPLDVLAFAASRVFRLADGTLPCDRPLSHTVTTGLWTHSVYWDLPELASAISDISSQ